MKYLEESVNACWVYSVESVSTMYLVLMVTFPDSKVHGANMGLSWGRQDPGGPHVGPMNLAIWVLYLFCNIWVFMCSTDPFKFRWLNGYICNSLCHYQIRNITRPQSSVFVYLDWLYYFIVSCFIYIQGKLFLFTLLLCILWCVRIIGYIMAWKSHSSVSILHYTIIIFMQI